ncbi:NmrA-like family protein [Truncatella angustata]|uniref:NmrA-like family protein n=1 Tax=Truncatella angustata TaxID=152316 RepID=A0A9P8UHF5_9PEZI|nr:NmrA-like family protein [Truncatella angustata]KAH6652206.1 NmrA-like family protein [Truncatella angustata]KAH8196688.1 hypothetical protein TruAng_009156 [Truncatella angustata]
MASENIIIFGPTGQVAAAAATFAQAKGAKVALAMRDTKKAIPGLSPEKEQSAGFERVSADLTKPETIQAAVEKTGAKRAFLYLIFGKPMRPAVEALKSSGIEFVVFNSSLSLTEESDLRNVSQGDYVAWAHAQVEIALEEIFGVPNYVTVRPGAFASNVMLWKDMVKKGEVRIAYPEAVFSYIAPPDIGKLCGALLVAGPQVLETKGGRNVVNLTGPELATQEEAVRDIGRVLGKEIPVVALSEQQGVKLFVDGFGMPESAAQGLVSLHRRLAESGRNDKGYQGDIYEEALSNFEKYTGERPTTLFQWLEENKGQFTD